MATDATKLVSLRFSETDYSKLKEEAASLGLKPAVLARVLIRASLNASREAPVRHSRKQFVAALGRLDRLVASSGAPAVDAVELIRQARDERDERLTDVLFPLPDE